MSRDLRGSPSLPVSALVLIGTLAGCTNASVYLSNGSGLEQGDRAHFSGVVCAPIPSGDSFPVKVLFALEGGAPQVTPDVNAALVGAMTDLSNRVATGTSISYALMAFHTTATALSGTFTTAIPFQMAINTFTAFQQSGPVNLISPLELAETILSGDMATACKGQLARTRYVVVMAFTSPDESCSNQVFNSLVDPTGCSGDGGMPAANCTACRLNVATIALKDLVQTYGAGEVDVLPIYYRPPGTMPDPVAQSNAQAIALAAGSTALVTDTGSLQNDLENLDYASLQKPLVLRQIFAWNINAIPSAGVQKVDSDGDGLADDDEVNVYGTDPLKYDSNCNGLGDGVEVRMGTDPLPTKLSDGGLGCGKVLQNCDPSQDTDGDRLNDCEELLLGTDPCQSDTDGDSFTDLVEAFRGTDPLVPEATKDTDRDGYSNVQELADHTDPLAIDLTFRSQRAYWTTVSDAPPTADGRACYNFEIGNVSLVATQAIPNPPFADIPAGTNDIYLYVTMGFSDGSAGEVGQLYVQQIQFTPPGTQVITPPAPSGSKGIITVTPDQFAISQ
jgi:hypothetical protein